MEERLSVSEELQYVARDSGYSLDKIPDCDFL